MTQGAICDGPGSGGTALACFTYPKEKFVDKPAFVAATFYVSAILSAENEEVCLKGSPDWYVIKSDAGKLRSITLFSKLLRSGATGQVMVNPGLHIELFTMENAMSWASKVSFTCCV